MPHLMNTTLYYYLKLRTGNLFLLILLKYVAYIAHLWITCKLIILTMNFRKDLLELYSDFLVCNSQQATATNLSAMVKGEVSHDSVTRLLSREDFDSSDLWLASKGTIRSVCSHEECYQDLPVADRPILSIDDSIIEKRYSSENELICWHYGHCSGHSVQGINLVSAL